MIAPRSSDNDGPLTWIGSFPVHVSTVLAGVHGATLILSALAMAAGAETALQAFVFSSSAVVNELSLWQMATYAFVHMPPYWLFLIELYLLVVFGREIEGYLGRGAFIRFYLTVFRHSGEMDRAGAAGDQFPPMPRALGLRGPGRVGGGLGGGMSFHCPVPRAFGSEFAFEAATSSCPPHRRSEP